jgi:hypothetical protein
MDPDLDLDLTLYKVKDKTNNMVIIHAMASWTTSFQSGLFVNVLLSREEETKQRDPFSHILRQDVGDLWMIIASGCDLSSRHSWRKHLVLCQGILTLNILILKRTINGPVNYVICPRKIHIPTLEFYSCSHHHHHQPKPGLHSIFLQQWLHSDIDRYGRLLNQYCLWEWFISHCSTIKRKPQPAQRFIKLLVQA